MCEIDIDYCALPEFAVDCANGGKCVDGIRPSDVTCKCPGDFYGARCELELDPCETVGADACQNGGICVAKEDAARKFICQCGEGFEGDFCETKVEVVAAPAAEEVEGGEEEEEEEGEEEEGEEVEEVAEEETVVEPTIVEDESAGKIQKMDQAPHR